MPISSHGTSCSNFEGWQKDRYGADWMLAKGKVWELAITSICGAGAMENMLEAVDQI